MAADCNVLVPENVLCDILSQPDIRDRYMRLTFMDHVKVFFLSVSLVLCVHLSLYLSVSLLLMFLSFSVHVCVFLSLSVCLSLSLSMSFFFFLCMMSHYYVHLWANILGKGMNPLIAPAIA